VTYDTTLTIRRADNVTAFVVGREQRDGRTWSQLLLDPSEGVSHERVLLRVRIRHSLQEDGIVRVLRAMEGTVDIGGVSIE
jgi:hypothetical protein